MRELKTRNCCVDFKQITAFDDLNWLNGVLALLAIEDGVRGLPVNFW